MLLIALIYKIRFRQTIPVQRWIGLCIIVTGIAAVGANKGISAAGSQLLLAFMWAACGSIVSAAGSIVVEVSDHNL